MAITAYNRVKTWVQEILTHTDLNAEFDAIETTVDEIVTKVDGIEAAADVTDTANVTAAGALMDSECADLASVKALDQGVATTDTPTFAGVNTAGNVDGRDVSADGTALDALGTLVAALVGEAAYATSGDVASATGGGAFDDVVTYQEAFDPGSKFDPTTGVYTVSAAGTYLCFGSVRTTGGSSGDSISLRAYDSTPNNYMGLAYADSNGKGSAAGACIIDFSGSGTLKMQVGTAASVVVQNAIFGVIRIGDAP